MCSSTVPISADNTTTSQHYDGKDDQHDDGGGDGGNANKDGDTNNADKDGDTNRDKDTENDPTVPRRTSLISNLNFPLYHRMDSNISNTSSFYRYSNVSTLSALEGEEFLGSSANSSPTMGDGGRKSFTQQQQQLLLSSTMEHPPNTEPNIEQKSLLLLLPSDATSSALAKAYRALAFQTLADQVKSSVRSHPGNEWMFLLEKVEQQPLRWAEELVPKKKETSGPILLERTPVRMDLSHSCWSDIFFLGMDYPEAARVINCSVDLAVQRSGIEGGNGNSDACQPIPPIECRLQLTTANPGTIKLTSVDLKSSVVLTHVSQVFNYGADYLGLLKAGLVAAGIVPLGLEKTCATEDVPLKDLLSVMMPTAAGDVSYGLELTTNVHDIPKGSRLAVSTNLLGSIIAVSMRATRQTSAASLAGTLLEPERRLVAARAILGEWLGGSGGGWQDSGGLWLGLKLIHGVISRKGDPEWGVSRGRLLPQHELLRGEDAPVELLEKLERSLVLVHGGMAQNVG